MQYVLSKNGFPVGKILDHSYWAIKRKNGSWLCEEDRTFDLLRGPRKLDWSLDIVTTGDWKRIRELWLFCPPNVFNPAGQTARLPITTPGTAFQLKVGHWDGTIAGSMKRCTAQLIGRVMDSDGFCESMIFDYQLDALIVEWKSNLFAEEFGTWQPGIAPIKRLALPVIGVFLPNAPAEGTWVVVEADHPPVEIAALAPVSNASQDEDCGCGNDEHKYDGAEDYL